MINIQPRDGISSSISMKNVQQGMKITKLIVDRNIVIFDSKYDGA